MKNLVIIACILLSNFNGYTQKKQKSKKDYKLDYDLYCFNLSHTGSVKYNMENAATLSYSGGAAFLPGRFDWYMPHDGSYGYSEGTALLSSFYEQPLPTGGFLEMGYGWMFNNQKARKSSKNVVIQYGMGLGFGIRQFWDDKVKEGFLYGMIWPEFSSITSIGDRWEVFPKFIFHPIPTGGGWGLRTSAEAMVAFRLLGPLSITFKASSETIRSEKMEFDTFTFSGKAKMSSFQFGIAFNSGK
jgi:hypothetical protein